MTGNSKRSGWFVVVGSAMALIVGNGPVLLFTFGVFLKPIVQETGWNRGTMSLGIAIGLTVAGLATPIVGRLIDRWGVQRVTLIAITLFAASVAAISLTRASIVVFILLYGISGLLSSAHAPLPYAKAISSWFDARRGLALGIAMAGVGVGTALMPQVANVLIQAFGWRGAYVALGGLTWLVAFPAVLSCVKDKSELRESGGTASTPSGDGVRFALRSTDFWKMAVAVFLVVTAVNGAIAHLVALLTDRGMPPASAASMLVGVGLSTLLGRLISGFLLDRVFAPRLAAAIFLVPLLGMVILWFGGASPVLSLVSAICFGFGLGAEVDVIGFLVGRYFGLRRYGEIYGYVFAIFTIGSGVGPYLMGLSFDAAHSYGPALAGFCALLLASIIIISRLGPYRYPATPTANGRPLAESAESSSFVGAS
jgi:predicted MFS family arabinose efflux permease